MPKDTPDTQAAESISLHFEKEKKFVSALVGKLKPETNDFALIVSNPRTDFQEVFRPKFYGIFAPD